MSRVKADFRVFERSQYFEPDGSACYLEGRKSALKRDVSTWDASVVVGKSEKRPPRKCVHIHRYLRKRNVGIISKLSQYSRDPDDQGRWSRSAEWEIARDQRQREEVPGPTI